MKQEIFETNPQASSANPKHRRSREVAVTIKRPRFSFSDVSKVTVGDLEELPDGNMKDDILAGISKHMRPHIGKANLDS